MERAVRQPLAIGATILLAAAFARAQEPYASQIAAMVPRVEQAVGLPFKTPPRFEVRSRAEIEHRLAHSFDGERPRAALVAEQTAMRLLGLIPDTLDWRALQLAIGNALVVGFYDPATKVLYLEDEPDDPQLGIVIPHELVHALQDQYVNVDSLLGAADDDRAIAARAALEGQATMIAFGVALGLGSDFPGSNEAIRESVEDEMQQTPILSTTPLFVRRLEVFPYLTGLAFMTRFQRERAGAQPFGADLPTSSAQLLHLERYFTSPRREPVAVQLAPVDGVTFTYENVFGEIGAQAILEQLLHDRKRAGRAADGWIGDRWALAHLPSGDALTWLTLWDSPREADEFASAMRRAVDRRGKRPSRAVTVERATVDSLPAVLYLDVPAGAPPALDIARTHAAPGAPPRE